MRIDSLNYLNQLNKALSFIPIVQMKKLKV